MDKAMHILLLIDYLGSGGAQRQLVMLARMLSRQGASVEVLTCFKADFFLPEFESLGVQVHHVQSRGKFERILAMRKAVRRRRPDVLIAFLKTPSILAELAGLPWRPFVTIVSERNTDVTGLDLTKRIRFFLHRFADAVVTNSYSQYQYILSNVPNLRDKLHVIGNCVDLDFFCPEILKVPRIEEPLRLLVLGRIHPQKDPFTLAAALILLRERSPNLKVQVDWYGEHIFIFDASDPHREDYFHALHDFIKKHGLQDRLQLHRPKTDVLSLYRHADLLCLPSRHEGCSNVIAEAMACGLPVLATRVGDNEHLVQNGVNGWLVDPGCPEQLADAIERFHILTPAARQDMGQAGRRRAEEVLSEEQFCRKYTALIEQLADFRGTVCANGQ